jgi:hypothetical protein
MHLRPSRFDARDDALAQHRRYRPIEGVQGFTRSHWTPLSDEYLLRIAPDGRRVRMPLKKYEKVPYLSAVSLALLVRRDVTKRIDRRRGSRAMTNISFNMAGAWLEMSATCRRHVSDTRICRQFSLRHANSSDTFLLCQNTFVS